MFTKQRRRNQLGFAARKAECPDEKTTASNSFQFEKTEVGNYIPSRYCSGAGEIFAGLPLAGRQAVVGCVPHKEYFHFLARCSIAEIPKTMAN